MCSLPHGHVEKQPTKCLSRPSGIAWLQSPKLSMHELDHTSAYVTLRAVLRLILRARPEASDEGLATRIIACACHYGFRGDTVCFFPYVGSFLTA